MPKAVLTSQPSNLHVERYITMLHQPSNPGSLHNTSAPSSLSYTPLGRNIHLYFSGTFRKEKMQGRGGRVGFFDFDPFAGFSGFDGMPGHQSMFSSVFGGRDPFDDPFFTRSFGSPFGSMFDSAFFGGNGNPFSGAHPSGYLEQQEPQKNKRRGPVIEEFNSDDEHAEDGGDRKMKDNLRKHSESSKEPYIEIPDDEADAGRNQHMQYRNDFNNRMHNMQPPSQSACYTFQSSSVSYGGANGQYYTKSMTKRAGSDGVVFEEFKEADSNTGQANHRISRGLHNKGHTLARKLNSDGRVDARQTLHNLNEEELPDFERAWEGSSGRHFTGGRLRLDQGYSQSGNTGQPNRGGWALPSTQPQEGNPVGASGNHAAQMRQKGKRAADRGSHGKMRA